MNDEREEARAAPGEVAARESAPGGPAEPESQAEVTRKSGLAYAAGIALFITVISFMGLGWLLDQWLQTGWLLVAGIVVGAIAGFSQFIRIISKIK
jgi:F0F1-type ATP synthase assembly protein I